MSKDCINIDVTKFNHYPHFVKIAIIRQRKTPILTDGGFFRRCVVLVVCA